MCTGAAASFLKRAPTVGLHLGLFGASAAALIAAAELVVGGDDGPVIALNELAFNALHGPKSLEIVPGANHLFSEPGALEQVIGHAARWFERYLAAENHVAKAAAYDL